VSSTDDASSRLSDALEKILSKTPARSSREDAARRAEPAPTEEQPAVAESANTMPPASASTADELTAERAVVESAADWTVDDGVDEVFELPEIVPATQPAPLPGSPPARPSPPTPVAHGSPSPAPRETAPSRAAAESASAPATAWGDHMAPLPANAQGAALRAPGRRPRVRRVTRVLRHIDPWSTFKVALLFSAVAYVVMLTAGVLLWRVADDTGTLANVERWFTQFGWETFELKGGEIFHNAWIIGLFGVVAMTGALVLLATLFNLVSDIVGGIRVTVLEEEVVERTVSSTRRYVVRRGPTETGTAEAPAQDWDVDGDEPNGERGGATTEWSVDDDDVGPGPDAAGG
jgi:hypothetical protein